MSDSADKKLRELAERVVAMSPEPPPYPEEVILTTPSSSNRRRSPALVFAGAAGLVLMIGLVAVFIGMDRGTDPAVSPTTVPTTAPTGSTAPVPSTGPSTTVPQATTFETMVFLVTDPENSFLGNPALVPFNTSVLLPGTSPDPDLLGLSALQLLGAPDRTVEPPPGFYNAVPQGVEFYGISRRADGAIVVDVSANFAAGAGGLLADFTMLNQVVYTVTWPDPEATVVFAVDGEVIDVFGSEGLVIGDGVGRTDFLDHLNSIIITAPFILDGDELPMVVGLANVFEATVQMRIIDADTGEVVHQDFTTATCGTGCWGEFGFSLDINGLEEGQLVQVYWGSPEDGSDQDVVTYPVGPSGEPWDFFPNFEE